MQVQALGHVVLKVRDLQRSEDFFSGMLGMPIISRISDPAMTFFALETSGNHHDFALMEVGFDADRQATTPLGLPTWHSRSAVQPRSSVLTPRARCLGDPGPL